MAVAYLFDVTNENSFRKIKEMYVRDSCSYFPECQLMFPKDKIVSLMISSKVDLKRMRKVPSEEVDRLLLG